KVEHLQSRVEEVAAYAGAMEEFLAEHGAGSQLGESLDELSELRTDLEAFDDRFESTTERIDSIEEETETVRSDVEAVESRVEMMDEDLISMTETTGSLEADVESVETTVDELGAGVSTL